MTLGTLIREAWLPRRKTDTTRYHLRFRDTWLAAALPLWLGLWIVWSLIFFLVLS
jgi:hypothetical protein